MAAIKYSTRGKANPSKISIRFILSKEKDYKRTIPLIVNPSYFNNKSGKVRKIAEFKDKDKLQNQLDNLHRHIINQYNKSITSKDSVINSNWLKTQIDKFFNVVEETDLSFLINYCDAFLEKTKLKPNRNTGKLGLSKRSFAKYKTTKTKLENYQKYKKRNFRLTDVNQDFAFDFLKYLMNVEKLAENTSGKYIGVLRTICESAKDFGLQVCTDIHKIKGFRTKVESVYLDFSELESIENTNFDCDRLESAKDWLIIGCYLGQRVSDLLKITKENISYKNGRQFIELIQQKTKKRISIPLHEKVENVLSKRNGSFPNPYSSNIDSATTILNGLIKEVCKKSRLTEIVKGAKRDSKTNRKKEGMYPKYELITSHICRRSFATNYYGTIPTSILKNITGHGTEKQFLEYIGKPQIDIAEQLAVYWDMEKQKNKKTPLLRKVQ